MKKLTIATILLVAAWGGAFAQKQMGENGSPKDRAEKRSQKMKTDLGLSDDQYQSVLKLNTETAEKRELERKAMLEQMMAKRKDAEASYLFGQLKRNLKC